MDGSVHPDPPAGVDGLGRLKTLFGQDWPRARRAVSDFFRIEKVKLRAAIRKVGKIPSRCLAFGRRQTGFKRIGRVKIERGHKVNPARPGGSSDRAHTDVVFLQTGNFLCERNVNRRIMLVECFGIFCKGRQLLPFDLSQRR